MVFEGAGSLNPSGTSRGGFGRVLPRDFKVRCCQTSWPTIPKDTDFLLMQEDAAYKRGLLNLPTMQGKLPQSQTPIDPLLRERQQFQLSNTWYLIRTRSTQAVILYNTRSCEMLTTAKSVIAKFAEMLVITRHPRLLAIRFSSCVTEWQEADHCSSISGLGGFRCRLWV